MVYLSNQWKNAFDEVQTHAENVKVYNSVSYGKN